MALLFYSYGLVMRRYDDDHFTEYPVNPKELTQQLSSQLTLDTGIITDDILYVRQSANRRMVIGYREHQMTGLFFEGSDEAVRTPLPPMILVKHETPSTVDYAIFAVRSKPTSRSAILYRAPLPNVYDGGSICWGSVQQPKSNLALDPSVDEDWKMLLGSGFGNHAVHGKSKDKMDIRTLLMLLDKEKKKRYPVSDLVKCGTFGELIS